MQETWGVHSKRGTNKEKTERANGKSNRDNERSERRLPMICQACASNVIELLERQGGRANERETTHDPYAKLVTHGAT